VNEKPDTAVDGSENFAELIRQQSANEIAELRSSAATLVQRLRANAAAEMDSLRAQARSVGETRGHQASAKRVAVAETESRKAWLWAREQLIEELLATAKQRLAKFPDVDGGTGTLQALIAEALRVLPPGAVSVRVSPACAQRLDQAACDMLGSGRWQLTITTEGAPAGGVIVESSDGRLRFDNSFEARIGRGRDRLRRLALDTLLAGEMPEW